MINTEDNQNQPNKDETQKQLSLIKYIFNSKYKSYKAKKSSTKFHITIYWNPARKSFSDIFVEGVTFYEFDLSEKIMSKSDEELVDYINNAIRICYSDLFKDLYEINSETSNSIKRDIIYKYPFNGHRKLPFYLLNGDCKLILLNEMKWLRKAKHENDSPKNKNIEYLYVKELVVNEIFKIDKNFSRNVYSDWYTLLRYFGEEVFAPLFIKAIKNPDDLFGLLYDPSNERAIVQRLSSSFYDDAIDKLTQTIKLTNLEKHQLEQLRIIKCY